MTSKLTPYLSFAGNAQEAMEYYRDVFGGELEIMPYSTFPTQDGSAPPEGIMHSALTFGDGNVLMGADEPRPGYQPPADVKISLSGDDGSTLRSYWEKLSADGTVTVPLDEQMWGDTFGMCTDLYGITWMVNIAKVPARV